MVAQQLNQNKCSGNILELEICVSNYSYDKESEKVTEQLQNVTWELREAESGSMDIKNKDWGLIGRSTFFGKAINPIMQTAYPSRRNDRREGRTRIANAAVILMRSRSIAKIYLGLALYYAL